MEFSRNVSSLRCRAYKSCVTLSVIPVNTQFDKIGVVYNTEFMSGPEAIAILQKLDISQRQFALLVGLHPNAVTKWANGTEPQGPAQALLRLLNERPEMLQVLRSAK
jgi:DNA-binding transcriptional regulator YiaG